MNVARRIHQIIFECNDAQRHLTIRRLASDVELPEPNAAPATYAEFGGERRARCGKSLRLASDSRAAPSTEPSTADHWVVATSSRRR